MPAVNSTVAALCRRPGDGFARKIKTYAALRLSDRIPSWIVYLIILIVPGALLVVPLIAGIHRYRRAVASQAVSARQAFGPVTPAPFSHPGKWRKP